MARGSKKQQAKQQNVKQSPDWKALDILVKKGYMQELERVELGRVKNKSDLGFAKSAYKTRYPGIFKGGKSSAFGQISAYIKSKGSARGINAKLQELIDAGKLGQAAAQQQGYKQQSDDLIKKINKIMNKPETQAFMAMDSAIDNLDQIPSGVLSYSQGTYDAFTRPLLLTADGKIKWAQLLEMVKGNNQFFGPMRIGLRKLLDTIAGEARSLKAQETLITDPLSKSVQDQVDTLFSNVTDFWSAVKQADQRTVATSGAIHPYMTRVVNGATVSYPTSFTDTTKVEVKSPSGKVETTFTMNEILTKPTNKATLLTYLNKVTALFGLSNFNQYFTSLRNAMVRSQTNFIRGTTEGSVPKFSSYSTQLISMARQLGQLQAQGKIDRTTYKKLYKQMDGIISKMANLPNGEELSRLGKEGLAKLRYRWNIIGHELALISGEISGAATLEKFIKDSNLKDKSRRQLILVTEKMLTSIADIPQATEQEKQSAFSTDTDESAFKAFMAQRDLSETLSALRDSRSDKEARLAFAKLVSQDDFRSGWRLATQLANKMGLSTVHNAAIAQIAGFRTMMSAKHQEVQLRSSFAVEPSVMFFCKPFSDADENARLAMRTQGEKYATVQRGVGNQAVGFVPLNIESTKPTDVLQSLPTKVQELSKTQAKARAIAAQKMLAQLMKRYNIVKNMAPAPQPTSEFDSPSAAPAQKQNKIYQANLAKLKKMLKEASYDSTLKNSQVTANGGLSLCGFIDGLKPKATVASEFQDRTPRGRYTDAPLAILEMIDLLFVPVFRSETYYGAPQSGTGVMGTSGYVDGVYTGTAKTQRQKFATQQGFIGQQKWGPQATPNTGNFLMKRHQLNELGEDTFYAWNANNAEDLRNRYFVSLYPFKLTGEFAELYNKELKTLRGETQIPGQQVDIGFVDSLLSL